MIGTQTSNIRDAHRLLWLLDIVRAATECHWSSLRFMARVTTYCRFKLWYHRDLMSESASTSSRSKTSRFQYRSWRAIELNFNIGAEIVEFNVGAKIGTWKTSHVCCQDIGYNSRPAACCPRARYNDVDSVICWSSDMTCANPLYSLHSII